jgi:hypothetical protein
MRDNDRSAGIQERDDGHETKAVRLSWHKPVVKRLAASLAENGSGPTTDFSEGTS